MCREKKNKIIFPAEAVVSSQKIGLFIYSIFLLSSSQECKMTKQFWVQWSRSWAAGITPGSGSFMEISALEVVSGMAEHQKRVRILPPMLPEIPWKYPWNFSQKSMKMLIKIQSFVYYLPKCKWRSPNTWKWMLLILGSCQGCPSAHGFIAFPQIPGSGPTSSLPASTGNFCTKLKLGIFQ